MRTRVLSILPYNLANAPCFAIHLDSRLLRRLRRPVGRFNTELPGVRQIDQLGGMLIGFIVISTWIGLAIVALAFVLKATDMAGSGLRDNMLMYFQSSQLIPIFYRFRCFKFNTDISVDFL